MNTRRNRDAFDEVARSDDDRVYVQEVPSRVDDVAPKLDRTEARELIGTAEVEPSGAVMAVELPDPVGADLIGEADVEPSGALMEDVSSVLGDDDDGDALTCTTSHL